MSTRGAPSSSLQRQGGAHASLQQFQEPADDAGVGRVVSAAFADVGTAARAQPLAVMSMPMSTAPVFDPQPDQYSVNEDEVLSVPAPGVLENDGVQGGTASVTLLIDPTSGSLSLFDNGSFEYQPYPDFNGFDQFFYSVSYFDGEGTLQTVDQYVDITIDPVNDGFVLGTDTLNLSTNEDEALTLSAASGVLLGAFDIDGDLLEARLSSPPTLGDVVVGLDGSIEFVPSLNVYGEDVFEVVISDGDPSFDQLVTVYVTIDPVNDAPYGDPDLLVAVSNTQTRITLYDLIGNDTDPDSDPLAVFVDSQPANGFVELSGDGGMFYTSVAGFNGLDTFTYVAWDGAEFSDPITVTMDVFGANVAPVAYADSYSVDKGGTLTVVAASGVLANDDDPDGPSLGALLVDGPTHGTLTLDPDGSFTYQPVSTYLGPDTFTYQADDGVDLSDVQTVTIYVNPIGDGFNVPPVAVPDEYFIDEDTTLTVPGPGLLANDYDPDDHAGADYADQASSPSNGTVTHWFANDGAFEYTPNPDFFGVDTFTYTVDDNFGDSEPALITIHVRPVNDAPQTTEDQYTVAEDGSLYVAAADGVLANDQDVDDTSLSAGVVTGPSNGVLELDLQGAFLYVPDPDYFGPDSFTYVASDGLLDSAVTTVHLTVTAVSDAPVAEPDAYVVTEDQPLVVTNASGFLSNDRDVDGQTLGFKILTVPAHGNLSLVLPGGGFTYVPAPNYNGPDSFSYRAEVADGVSLPATVSLDVQAVNDAPTGSATATLPDAQSGASFFVATSTLLQGFQDIDDAVLTVQSVGGDGSATPTSGGFDILVPAGFSGPGQLTYEVTDGKSTPLNASLQYGVVGGNRAPTIDTVVLNPVREHLINAALNGFDSKILGTVAATDADGDALTWSIVTDSSGGALRIDAKTGVLSVRDVSLLDVEGPGVFTHGLSYLFLDVRVSDGDSATLRSYALQVDDVINDSVTTATDFVDGTATAQVLAAGIGNDVVFGDEGDDNLAGGAGWDYLYGGAGTDVLNGGDFEDHLFGGAGVDTMTGGGGRDWFVFSTPPGEVDTITDFARFQDVLWLVNDVPGLFTALPNGPLAAAAFDVVGVGPAASAATRVTYSPATGLLAYDADGTGPTAPQNFASIGINRPIVAADLIAGPNPTRDNAAPVLSGPVPPLPAGQVNVPTPITAAALLGGFSDADGDPLSIVGLTSSVGTLVDQGNGSWTLNTPLNFVGAVTLAYGVSDGQATTAGARLQPVAAGAGSAPLFTSGATLGTVREHLFNATATGIVSKTVGTVVATDPDAQPVSYTLLTDSSGGAFALNGTSGAVTVRDLSLLDFEGPGLSTDAGGRFYSLGVSASDGTFSTTQVVKVYVTDVASAAGTGGNDWLDRGAANDVLNSGAGTDFVFGDGGSDTLTGGASWDYLYGGGGADTMVGNDGDDTFYGGAGADTMTGGNGRDTYVFAGTDGAGGADTVSDFNVLTDRLMLVNDRGPFDVLPTGTLAAAAFDVVGVGPVSNGSTRVLYDPATGALFFDADGTGPSVAVQLATLAPNLALAAGNVVAQPLDFP